MRFIDEANIVVSAGRGGNGCVSFRRERFVPRGGPNGGNGGDGGDVWLRVGERVSTLAEYRHKRHCSAHAGHQGGANDRSGACGEDLELVVPPGTVAVDTDDDNVLGDLTTIGERLCVARGGQRGFGNAHFKSSINRAPRRSTPGQPGETRTLRLELRLLADVGLLGLPNAGKSTLLCAISNARPKTADYPFTTLEPVLGVVDIGASEGGFVVADVPGIIQGAASGAGMGLRFLRHLSRTRLLLHIVDLLPEDGSDPADNVRIVNRELQERGGALSRQERWLVLNKIDRLAPGEQAARCDDVVQALDWSGPVYPISAAGQTGLRPLCRDAMAHLESRP